MNASEAAGDLALIQTSPPFKCKFRLVCISTTWFTHKKVVRSVSNQRDDPFNRNFRKFRSKLNASVRSKIFEKVGLPFVVNHFSRLDWSERKLAVSFDHSIPVPRYSVFSTCYLEKSTYHCSFWIANSGSIGVTLIFHLCAVATGLYLIPKPIVTFDCLKANYFPREFGMFFSSLGSRIWTHTANIWEWSAQNNLLCRLNYCAWNSHSISLISPSKSSCSSNRMRATVIQHPPF